MYYRLKAVPLSPAGLAEEDARCSAETRALRAQGCLRHKAEALVLRLAGPHPELLYLLGLTHRGLLRGSVRHRAGPAVADLTLAQVERLVGNMRRALARRAIVARRARLSRCSLAAMQR